MILDTADIVLIGTKFVLKSFLFVFLHILEENRNFVIFDLYLNISDSTTLLNCHLF